MQLTYTLRQVSWRSELRAAHAEHPGPRPLVLVRLEAPDGIVGFGEAAPLENYDGVSAAMVIDALEAYAPLLAAAGTIEHGGHPAVLEACRLRADLPQALAAVDLALWDLAGRRADQPVWRLLGAATAPPLAVNAVIGADEPAAVVGQAAAAIRGGFGTLKVKVGVGDDMARLRAIRTAVGPDIAIRIDANGAWRTVEAALLALDALASIDIELCEEPVHGVGALAAVAARSPIPIAADESVGAELLSHRVTDSVCLKISTGGGISGLIDAAGRARHAGYGLFLASTLDGPLGIAAALHAAALIAPDRACGLATLDRFVARPPFSPAGGTLLAPAGPGLGDGLVEWYEALPPTG